MSKKLHILIAEDDEYSFMYLSKLFLIGNNEVYHASNGVEAVKLIKEIPEINLILMDIKMPVMDGYEATRLIRELRPDIPIIAQTAYAFSDDRLKALDSGCNDYVSKPISKDVIIKIVEKYSK